MPLVPTISRVLIFDDSLSLSERLNMFEHCVNNLLMQEALEALRKDSKVSF